MYLASFCKVIETVLDDVLVLESEAEYSSWKSARKEFSNYSEPFTSGGQSTPSSLESIFKQLNASLFAAWNELVVGLLSLPLTEVILNNIGYMNPATRGGQGTYYLLLISSQNLNTCM